jgi:hypothetical protein
MSRPESALMLAKAEFCRASNSSTRLHGIMCMKLAALMFNGQFSEQPN